MAGLVEWFNQTLKEMLRQVVGKHSQNWDLFLPYILFSVKETPQVSMGLTEFLVLFRGRPWGLLDVAKEAWEEQPLPFRTTIKHVRDILLLHQYGGPNCAPAHV